ncbi:hypothetical protein [Prauserella marina]|nr:hypothetical protein [Prauserella marina]
MYSPPEEVETMSQFATVLRSRVDDAHQAMIAAQQAGHDYEVHLHSARLRDLLDLAARHDVDTTGWVDLTALDPTETA